MFHNSSNQHTLAIRHLRIGQVFKRGKPLCIEVGPTQLLLASPGNSHYSQRPHTLKVATQWDNGRLELNSGPQ